MNFWFIALAFLTVLTPSAVQATTQIEDVIILDGEKHFLNSLPLEQYFGPSHPRPQFRPPHTALWRGYVATWEIKGGMLYLTDLEAWTSTGRGGLEVVFPDRKGPVPATWVTGELKIPQGKIIKPYVPYPLYEKYLIISVEKGRVVGRKVTGHVGDRRRPGL